VGDLIQSPVRWGVDELPTLRFTTLLWHCGPHDLAVNKKLITCPDHRDVVINSDQRIIDAFRNPSGAGRQSIDQPPKAELKNLAVHDDCRTTIRQKNVKHGFLITLGDTIDECLNGSQDRLFL